MKRFYLILVSFMLMACGHQPASEADGIIDSTLQTGDLLFVGIPLNYTLNDTADMADAIVAATGDSNRLNFIHVAIVEVSDDTTWVIDATIKRGVSRYPLDTMLSDFRLKDGSYPEFVVMRLRDNSNVSSYVEKSKAYIGRSYDMWFLPDNKEQYCSELVRNAYCDADSSYWFAEAPMNFKSADGTFPPYWVQLFELLGQPVPQGVMGTNPNDMSADSDLIMVRYLYRK